MLSLAIHAMTSYQDLWLCYFNDFITHKLKLVDQDHAPSQDHSPRGGDMAQQFLCTYFEELHFLEMPNRLAELHCNVSTYQLYLAQMATILRPLSKIGKVRGALEWGRGPLGEHSAPTQHDWRPWWGRGGLSGVRSCMRRPSEARVRCMSLFSCSKALTCCRLPPPPPPPASRPSSC